MSLIKNRDIIVVGQQAWDTPIGSNCKDIALEFSKHNRVLYVNPALDRRTKIQQSGTEEVKKRISIIKGNKKSIEQINQNLYIYYPEVLINSINFIKWTSIFRIFNKLNNKKIASSLNKIIHQLSFKNYIIFNDGDMFRSFHLKDLINPDLYIYYSRDNLMATSYWSKHGKKLEPEIIRKSDVCVANSEYLVNYCKQYNPKSYYVGQGCDLSMFNPDNITEIPKDLFKINKPIIGYIGALLATRLDENILIHLAKSRPEWNIVLIGPEDDVFKRSILHQLDNVYFFGAKKPETLASYIKGFDVCLNPQAVNPLTIGNYPRKIDEYLAMGKPTIATQTEAINIFRDYIYIAKSKEDYVELIDKALTEDCAELIEKRITFAKTHTWENNVAEIYKVIITAENHP